MEGVPLCHRSPCIKWNHDGGCAQLCEGAWRVWRNADVCGHYPGGDADGADGDILGDRFGEYDAGMDVGRLYRDHLVFDAVFCADQAKIAVWGASAHTVFSQFWRMVILQMFR